MSGDGPLPSIHFALQFPLKDQSFQKYSVLSFSSHTHGTHSANQYH